MFFVSLIISTLVVNISSGPTYDGSASENQVDLDYKVTLQSIEDKLRNIENSLNVQYVTTLNGKIDYYGRKIDNIEKELSRFQRFMTMELDKISENISAGNFKADVANDKTVRKIDTVYERINHKLGNIEGQIDLSSIKSQSGRDMITSKLDKIEETLTIRDSDMEAELADAIAAIDDLKTSCSNIEGNVINVTKETAKMVFKHGDKNLKKYFNQTIIFLEKTNQSFSNEITKLSDTINFLTSQVNDNSILMNITNKEFNENMNDYGNKMTDAFSDMTETTTALKDKIEHLAKIANTSRFEQQNSLRALTVEVGRNVEKPSEMSMNDENFKKLSDDIESKFENIMGAQNLFIESCHRVQMDESQLETQISVVLDKLIDIFVNKTTIGPKDIEKLENLIRMHDVTIRRSFNQITNELLKRIQQISIENEEDAKNLKVQIEEIYFTVHDILISNDNSKKMQSVLHIFHDLQQQFNITNNQVLASLNENYANRSSENKKLQIVIKNMHDLLRKMENKINKSLFNESNIDEIVDRFGKKLKEYIKNARDVDAINNAVQNNTKFEAAILQIFGENPNKGDEDGEVVKRNETEIDALIFEIFGETPNEKVENKNDSLLCYSVNNTKCETHTFPKQNMTELDAFIEKTFEQVLLNTENVENNVNDSLLCVNSTKCETSTFQKQNLSDAKNVTRKCSKNILNLIDVRMNSENCSDSIDQTNSANIVNREETTNCSSNYGDLIDVRFNPNCNTTDQIKFKTENDTNVALKNCSDYRDLIDVRSGIPDCIPPTDPEVDKTKNDTQVKNTVNLGNCSNYRDLIDVRSKSSDCIPKMDEQAEIGQSEVDEFNIDFTLSPDDEFEELLKIERFSTESTSNNEEQL